MQVGFESFSPHWKNKRQIGGCFKEKMSAICFLTNNDSFETTTFCFTGDSFSQLIIRLPG
jgi:hypothetical protein